MTKPTVIELYESQIRALPAAERLQLLSLIAGDLAGDTDLPVGEPLHDVMEFHGAGRKSWDGSDAQQFVNELRAEWDQRQW